MFQNGREVVFHGAGTVRAAFEFAGETTYAALEVQRVEVDQFGFGSGVLCALNSLLEQFGGVPISARTAVNRD